MNARTFQSIFARFMALVSLLLVCGCQSGQDSGPNRYRVAGQVLVDGKPAHRVLVQLVHLEPPEGGALGNDAYPSGYTDSEGKFVIGRDNLQPGAIAGKHKVLFTWMSTADLDAIDLFQGRYADASQTTEWLDVPSERCESLEYRLSESP
jgi:hypothetical protein